MSATDKALGWNWLNAINFVDAHRLIAQTLNAAYASFNIQLGILPLILVISGQIGRAYEMTTMAVCITLVSSVISIWYPAVGTYAFYDFDANGLNNVKGPPLYIVQQLIAVKQNPNFIFEIGRSTGIMTFPSVHAAISVLCAWAAWHNKMVRYPFLALNILMGLSALIVSCHYLVDVIAGVGVGALVISSVSLLTRAHQVESFYATSNRAPRMTPLPRTPNQSGRAGWM